MSQVTLGAESVPDHHSGMWEEAGLDPPWLDPKPPAAGVSLVSIKNLCERTGTSTSTAYERIASGDYPPGIAIGPHQVRYRSDWVEATVRMLVSRSGRTSAIDRVKLMVEARAQKRAAAKARTESDPKVHSKAAT